MINGGIILKPKRQQGMKKLSKKLKDYQDYYESYNVGDIITTKRRYGINTEFVVIKIDKFTKAHTVIIKSKIENIWDTGRRIPLSVIHMHYKKIGKHLNTIFKDL
jgi:hypothetical protein